MDWLASVFLGAFLFGFLFCVASLVLGLGHFGFGSDGVHLDGPHDVQLQAGGHGVDASASDSTASPGISPWNVTGLTAFVAFFGGVGYLALIGWELAAWVSLLIAGLAGVVGWATVYLFFTRVLAKGESRLDPADYRLEGSIARVTSTIQEGRIGEIQYTMGGVRRSDGARSVDGATIERGSEVVIVRYERGIAYVEPWQEYVGETAAEAS